MKLVTFAEPMAPHGVGDTRLVTDEVAARLTKGGVLSGSTTFPPKTPEARKPTRGAPKDERLTSAVDKRMAR